MGEKTMAKAQSYALVEIRECQNLPLLCKTEQTSIYQTIDNLFTIEKLMMQCFFALRISDTAFECGQGMFHITG